jgi:hypothetical protein
MLTKYNFDKHYTLGTSKINVLEALNTEATEAASVNIHTITTPSIWLSGSRVSTKVFQFKLARLPVAAAIFGSKTPAKLIVRAANKAINDMLTSLIIELFLNNHSKDSP